jgi:endonuclease/exonuclease/phosphatase family metal-dependent hydrolase
MRLLSYNIHKGIGGRDRRYRIERVINVIEAENPDIICLQEVDRHCRRSRNDDQPKVLADYFKLKSRMYQPNVSLKYGMYGNLVLSRWPFLHKHQISLRLNNRKPRGAQMAVIDSPEGPFHLINFHLGLAEKERHWQLSHLFAHHTFKESGHLPVIIIGDFNDWRNTLCYGCLGEQGFAQLTTPTSKFRSFPAYWPLGSLDKAFVRGDIVLRQARIVRSPIARLASDHLPLVVDFHLGGK